MMILLTFYKIDGLKKKKKIYKFLDETISMLEKDLNLIKTNKKKL